RETPGWTSTPASRISGDARLCLRTSHGRVVGAGGPDARNDDETRVGPLSRSRDAADGPPSPTTRRAEPEWPGGLRCSSSTAWTRLVSSSRLARRAIPAQRVRGTFSDRAYRRGAAPTEGGADAGARRLRRRPITSTST